MTENNLYFVALLTPEAISQKIISIQKTVSEKFQSHHALKSPPHITLIPPFRMDEISKNKFMILFAEFFSRFSPFEIQLNGFSCFEKNGVIFIHVSANTNLALLYDALKQFVLKSHPHILKQQLHTFTPHITIASRDLRKEMFHEAWNEFKEKTFTEIWTTGSAYLLRHTGKEWVSLSEFKLRAK